VLVTTGTVIDELAALLKEVDEIELFPPVVPRLVLTGAPPVVDVWYDDADAELPLVAAVVDAAAPPFDVAPLAEPDATLELPALEVYELEFEVTAAPDPLVLAVPDVEVAPVIPPERPPVSPY
jgi:hypothetical protein